MIPIRFSVEWWDSIVAAWNASAFTPTLADFGLAEFAVVGDKNRVVRIFWGHNGIAHRQEISDARCPRFSATEQNWEKFVLGQFTATMGVMTGRIQFQGSPRTILKYTSAFNNLAAVSRNHL